MFNDDSSGGWKSVSIVPIPPGVLRCGIVIELNTPIIEEEGLLTIRNYYVSEYESLMDETIAEFPIEKEENKENVTEFFKKAWRTLTEKFGKVEKVYLDEQAEQVIKEIEEAGKKTKKAAS